MKKYIIFTILFGVITLVLIFIYGGNNIIKTSDNLSSRKTNEALIGESNIIDGWKRLTLKNNDASLLIPDNRVPNYINDNYIVLNVEKVDLGTDRWGIRKVENIESNIVRLGQQFNDRQEQREEIVTNFGSTGLLVTVTTKTNNYRISKHVYFEKGEKIYLLANGAIEDPDFTVFYKNFQRLE